MNETGADTVDFAHVMAVIWALVKPLGAAAIRAVIAELARELDSMAEGGASVQ